MKWLPIEELHNHVKGREMFVVKAFGVIPYEGVREYDSDPYCVWWDKHYEEFARWPHPFEPTHFCLLPDWEE